MRIGDSARRHGVADSDMLHAVRVALRTIAEQDGGRRLIIGVGTHGQLLEVVIKDAGDDTEPEIIHAMALRKSYYKYL